MDSDEIVRSKRLIPQTFESLMALDAARKNKSKEVVILESEGGVSVPSLHTIPDWPELRDKAIDTYGAKCMCCGSIKEIHVDHIKPRSIYPELTLCFDNLQVLCRYCNFKKGLSETDYRVKE